MHSTEPEATLRLASVETSALGRLLGVLALEGLELESRGSVGQASEGGFLDETVATGFDVVHATSNFVVATNGDFLGRVGSGIVLASDFVLEWFWSFDPGAAQTAFDHGTFLVALSATGRTYGDLVVVDVAFVDDILLEETFAIIQAFAVVDATGGFGHNFLATNTGASEPIFVNFVRVSNVVLVTVFNATGGHHTRAVVDGSVAKHDQGFGDHFVVQSDAFALIDASRVDRAQSVVFFFAGEEIGSVFPLRVDLVVRALMKTGDRFQVHVAAVQVASQTEGFLIGRAADLDVFQFIGDTTFGHEFAVAALIEEMTAFQKGAI